MEALPEEHDTARAIAHEVRYNLEIAVQRRTGKRKSAPKVKTACITCKVRRVKCDETKPNCLRCINYWGFCEGYTKSQPRIKPPPWVPSRRAKILIAPAPNSGVRKKSVVTIHEILQQPYIGPTFETGEENRLFKIFLNSTSAALSGAFDSPTWGYLLPQHSFIEPFIRYGVTALGAMTASFMDVMADRLAGNLRGQENCLATSKNYKKAVALYDKSIRYMRITLSKPNHNIRDALLGCLLASCFEGFHGHNYASVIHAQHGLDIFYKWLDRQSTVKSRSSPLRSPNPTEVDDDLVATMYRLDLHVLSFFDSRSMRTHSILANHDTQSLESMPSVFLSLSQARHYWDLISCRICHFLAFTLSSTGNKSTALLLRGRSMPYPEALDAPIGVKLFAQGAHVPVGYEAERAEYSAECKAWERAYAPLSKQLWDASKAQTCGATILLMHAKMMRILLAGAFFKSDMEYDHILPDFQSIYDLAVSIWPSHIIAYDVGVSYNFELGVLPPLFLVVTRCRDHDLRCQVIDLLFTSFHRENCWDSFGIAFIGRWIMRMEEARQVAVTCSVDEIRDADPLHLNFSVECLPKGEIQDVLQMTIIQEGLAAAEEEAKSRAEALRIRQRGSLMDYSSGEDIPGELDYGSSSESVKSTRSIGSSGGDVEDVILEERRVRITRFYVDLNLRRAQLEYTQGPVWGKEEVVCGDNVVRW